MIESKFSIAIEGQQIFALPEADRYADIVEPSPEYTHEDAASGASAGMAKTLKLICNVKLKDGRVYTYYMNRTSARVVAKKLNTDLEPESLKTWVGHRIYWGQIADMKVGLEMKKVLYVTDAKKTIGGVVPEKVKL
jgi:hypothetical protein